VGREGGEERGRHKSNYGPRSPAPPVTRDPGATASGGRTPSVSRYRSHTLPPACDLAELFLL